MANDYSIFFQQRQPDYSVFFPKIDEAEANRTLTPEEQAKVVAPGRTWGEAWESAKKVAPGELVGILTGASPPMQLMQFGLDLMQKPKETLDQAKEHYGGYLSEEGLKEKLATQPISSAIEVGSVALPFKGGIRPRPRVGPEPMPRGSIRAQDELIGSGGKNMNTAKKSDVALPPEEIVPSFAGFHARLGEKGIRINKKLHPKTYAAFEDFTNFIRPKGMDNAPRPATMLDLHEVRQLADNAAKDKLPDGRPSPDAMLANELLATIDEVITKHPDGPQFMQGKGEIARGYKSRGLLDLVEKAKNTTQWDRGDHAGALRNKINTYIRQNKRFLSKKDLKELRRIKRYGFTEALGGQGSLSPMALAIGRAVEFATGLPYTSLIFAGKIAREAANKRMPQRLERMAERIRAGE